MRWVGAVCLGVDGHLFALGKRAYREWDENVGLARGREWDGKFGLARGAVNGQRRYESG